MRSRVGKRSSPCSTLHARLAMTTSASSRSDLIRINKYLAEAGVASRRAADELIARGAVTIDGVKAKPGDRVDPSASDVRVNGKRVRAVASGHITIALNKPAGVITTMRDERGRPCVGDLLRLELRLNATPGRSSATTGRSSAPTSRRMFPIGRLDAQTTGLLLCTSDGELGRRLSHPSFEVARRYRVTVDHAPTGSAIRALNAERIRPRADGAVQFEMTLTRGQNREIRRACAQQGLRVIALERVSYGPITLRDLTRGTSRRLTPAEMRALQQAAKEGPP
jgi:23S rRNA pseudouridine2605 synthase